MRSVHTSYIFLLSLQFLSCSPNVRDLNWPIPAPGHVVIVMFENHSFEQILNDTGSVFIQQLANDTAYAAVFSNSWALDRPSQPNYFQLFSGSNQGILNNERPPKYFITKNLAANLLAKDKTFITYSEGLPFAGYDGEYFERYVRKHNPVTNWVGNGQNQVDSLLNQPFTNFPSDFDSLPTVCYVIPDMDHDMHDGSIAMGDAWLQTNLGAYIEYTKTHQSLFILTFDEGAYDEYGNHILTIIYGSDVKAGTYAERIDHTVLLRTIEDMYDLDHAGEASHVDPVVNCWAQQGN